MRAKPMASSGSVISSGQRSGDFVETRAGIAGPVSTRTCSALPQEFTTGLERGFLFDVVLLDRRSPRPSRDFPPESYHRAGGSSSSSRCRSRILRRKLALGRCTPVVLRLMGILPVPETPGPFPRSEVPEQERPPKRLDAGVSLGTATTDVRWRTRGGRDRRAHRPLHGSAADRGLRARQRQSRTRSAPPRVPPRRPAEAHLRCAPDHDARRKQRRQGFVEPATFHEITKHLIPPLDDVARFDYLTGSRKSEVLTLAWSNVDRARGVITIAREHSKNAEPRIIALTAALAAIIERRWKARTISRPDGVVLADLVFHREGRPVGSTGRSLPQ